ncbi:MAG: right-handed parallel beta-helix repeat-containing protein [Planctomycetota bacterium]|jgi:parallel beta-helix repeat protein
MRVLVGFLLAAAALGGEIAEDTVLKGERLLTEPLRVVADGVTLDLSGAVLRGAEAGTAPDHYRGIGLIVEGRKNVTIRGGRLWGFKCAVLVKDCENVALEGIDVSGNFRQRLRSTPEKEHSGDWLWPHENDAQQWRKNYGAGICLESCRKCVVRECVGRKQQNGLILDRCEEMRVYDNDFSFNSGWGIALWRSSRNTLSRNSCDWCVRGYSHGVYARGQDSAGFLVFEQCHENVFWHNSATHGGDGFFLYAGNETLKRTGQGGCNDNYVYRNDFSHAVANAIEATFSKGNRFHENRCDDSNYGIWAGYSYDTEILDNRIYDNSIAGIAIEHGTRILIQRNRFERNPRGIWLWWDNDEDLLKSKFGKSHPCLSKTYLIVDNKFREDKVAIYLRRSTDYNLTSAPEFSKDDNSYANVGARLDADDASAAGEAKGLTQQPRDLVAKGPGRREAFLAKDHPRGRKHILVDEWGPLDPREFAVFPRRVVAWGACAFHVLGPASEYTVEGLPAGLAVEKGERTFRVRGGLSGLTEFGCKVRVGGKTFPLTGLLLNAEWRIRHWKWDKDPREHPGAWKQGEPAADFESDRLDYTWAMGGPDGVPADRFATRAETRMKLPAGRYEIRTVSDDGVRVLIDGRTVQEDWTWHGPKENKSTVELKGGDHTIVVEHFEIDGYAVLRFDLRPLR